MTSHRLRLAATAIPLSLLLAGCGSGDAPGASGPSGATATAASSSVAPSPELDAIKVAGAAGAKPTITPPKLPFAVNAAGYRVIAEGSGAPIGEDNAVTAHFLLLNGKDAKEIQSSFGQQVVSLSMADPTLQEPIRAALVGRKVGARVLIAVPAKDAVGEQGNPEMGVGPGDTLLYYFEVTATKTPLKEASGTAVPPKAGLPTVTMGATPKDPASFAIPKGATPPKTTVAQPLIVGKGPKVLAGQTVRVSYTGVTWRDPGTPFDFSGKTPQGYAEFQIGTGQLIKAWDKSIPGQPVGSRLLLIVPPADGYGAAGQGQEIKGTDTLIFVLDILDAS